MDRGDKPRDDIDEPTALASQRPFRSRVGGRRSRALGLRPMTSWPLTRDWAQKRPARSRPHLPGRLFGQLTDPGRTRTSASLHPGPALALGWSVHQPGEVSGLQPSAPVL